MRAHDRRLVDGVANRQLDARVPESLLEFASGMPAFAQCTAQPLYGVPGLLCSSGLAIHRSPETPKVSQRLPAELVDEFMLAAIGLPALVQ